MSNLDRVHKLAYDMASYIHHIGYPVYDGGHSEPEATCAHPDCATVRDSIETLKLIRENTKQYELQTNNRCLDFGAK